MDIVELLRENADLDAAEHVPAEVVQMQINAANEIERLQKWHIEIAGMAADYDEDGATAPRAPMSWESVARLAIDYSREALKPPNAELTG